MLQRRLWVWLVFVPIVIHWPALSGWLSADPLYLTSGLTRSWQANGVFPGQPGWIDGNAGVTLEALGRLVAHDWKSGIVPWWNPYTGVGLPLAGEMQPAAFFVPFVLLLGVAGGVLYLKITMMMIGGLAMWGLLLQIGLAPVAALLGGLLFQLNGTFAWDSDSSSLPVAFLPLFLLGIERALAAARTRQRGGWRILCAGMAYSLLAGFPETAFIDGLLAATWASLRLVQARGVRAGFAARVAAGGGVALALCAPLLLAFGSFYGQSEQAGRAMGHAGLHAGDYAMFLFPNLYGPIFFGNLFDIWFRIGGYVSAPVALMAVAAVLRSVAHEKTRERALRWVLFAWISVALAKAGDVAGITGAINLIPMVSETLFYRYAAVSWEAASIILAAMAFDDFMEPDAGARRRWVWAAAVCGTACLLVLLAGRPVWRELGSVPAGRTWFYAAVLWGTVCTVCVWLVGTRGARWRMTMFGILALDAAIQFTVPLLSGTRGDARNIDLGPVGFLKANLGLNRFYTLGPLSPNYTAFYQVAGINHNYAPVPRDWVKYIRASLDPNADPVTFNGTYPSPSPGVETRPEALLHHISGYEEIGVKFVVTPPGLDPFAVEPTSEHVVANERALSLQAGQSISAHIGASEYGSGQFGAVGLSVGTYGGTADGTLVVKFCVARACAYGSTALPGIRNNTVARIELDHSLAVRPGDVLDLSVTREGGVAPVALWLWRGAAKSDEQVSGPGDMPQDYILGLLLYAAEDGKSPHLVFRSHLADIYELPNPAPYFKASSCTISDAQRTSLQAYCDRPSMLTRRELWFPGWTAEVNAKSEQVSKSGIFQTIPLPAGHSMVRFAFAPPGIFLAYIAAAIGGLIFLIPLAISIVGPVRI